MEEMLKELLSFIEGDANWWDEAARNCEDLGTVLGNVQGSKWHLLCALYYERAKTHRQLVAKMRERLLLT